MLLLSELNKSNILVFSFEEGLNEVTQTCKIDGYVGFWNKTELKVNVWFIVSTFFDHETYQNLLKHFHKVTKELDCSTLYQVTIVGPSMNLKLYKEIVQDRQKYMVYSLLIEIGSWSLHIHVFHCNIETGAEKLAGSSRHFLKFYPKFFMTNLLEEKITNPSLDPISTC